MRRIGMVLMVILTGSFFLGPDCPPEEPPDALKVIQAIHSLDDPDYSVVRDAIRKLNQLVGAPNIRLAVKPLIQVLSCRDGFYDSYTRCMAAHSLVGIGADLGWPRGKKPINAVISELENGNIDIVRAACAKALARIDWDSVYDPLVTANENDSSPLVRASACEALLMYTNGSYSSPTCHYEESELSLSSGGKILSTAGEATTMGVMSVGSARNSDKSYDQDMMKWIETHVLLPPEAILKNAKVDE